MIDSAPALTTWEIARFCVYRRAPIVLVYVLAITHSTLLLNLPPALQLHHSLPHCVPYTSWQW